MTVRGDERRVWAAAAGCQERESHLLLSRTQRPVASQTLNEGDEEANASSGSVDVYSLDDVDRWRHRFDTAAILQQTGTFVLTDVSQISDVAETRPTPTA